MNDNLFIVLFGSLALIPVVQILWLRIVQPARLGLADLGYEMLNDPITSEDQKAAINNALDDAFNWQFGIAMALLATPVFLLTVLGLVKSKNRVAGRATLRLLEDHPRGDEFINQFFSVLLLTNPIAGLLAILQIFVIGVVLVVCLSSYKRASDGIERILLSVIATWGGFTDSTSRLRVGR